MKWITLILLLIGLSTPSYYSQDQDSAKRLSNNDEREIQRLIWLHDLKVLETESMKLDGPLARALTKGEIAAAAWSLDETWSKRLLREAFELTFPAEEDQAKLRGRPVGASPVPPTSADRARSETCRRLLQIAGRDRSFANELAQLSKEKLGSYEAHLTYTSLALQAFNEGDKEAASKFFLQAIDADPTQITAAFMLRDIAMQDRALADNLILQYIERLRVFPLSTVNQSVGRIFFILNNFVFPPRSSELQVAPPGPAVMRAYVSYVIYSLSKLEEANPANLQTARPILISTWPLVRQYAPELTSAFFALEQRSRKPGGDGAPGPESVDEMYEAYRSKNDQRIKSAVDSDQPDEGVIHLAISRGDFAKARKMIDKLADGPQKTQLIELVNAREALSLVAKGDILGADTLAERLTNATSILQVYPQIIKQCVADKDQACADTSVRQAMTQLRRADTSLPAPPAGIPASAMASNRELDPVLLSLSRFAKAIASVNEVLALEVLDEMVLAANRSQVDTGQGHTGFESDVFKILAQKNEVRTRQAATDLKDRLQRIVALATIYQGLLNKAKNGL
jgi:tetratricopeptide (TPR) repeat protein